MLTATSANVNGIRAAHRRGGLRQFSADGSDVLLLQEVRATDEQLRDVLADAGLGDWHLAHAPSSAAGRAGVAVVARSPLTDIRTRIGSREFADSGRWVEATAQTAVGALRLVSVYVHTGEAETERQAEKYRFLDAMTRRLRVLSREARQQGGHVLVCGDLNVAHTEDDIKNWRGNIGKAGFLEEERAYLDRWRRSGWVDLGRRHAGPGPGPYTWWSWRGQAFDNDAGWRIDYALATPELAEQLSGVTVGRAPSYAERWSDHAPLTATFG